MPWACEDLIDHETLRHDPGIQTAVEHDRALASPASLWRFENRANREWAWALHEVLIETFMASHKVAPRELALDFDATGDAVHGHQKDRFFHGYYDHDCFLPLYVFAGDHLLVAYLRPSKAYGVLHARAILKLLVQRLRETWPGVRIVCVPTSPVSRCRIWYCNLVSRLTATIAASAPGRPERQPVAWVPLPVGAQETLKLENEAVKVRPRCDCSDAPSPRRMLQAAHKAMVRSDEKLRLAVVRIEAMA